MHRELGGDRLRTTGPERPKGYSIPYSIMMNNKTGEGVKGVTAAQGLGGHQSVDGVQLCFASFILHIILSLLLFLFYLPFLSF